MIYPKIEDDYNEWIINKIIYRYILWYFYKSSNKYILWYFYKLTSMHKNDAFSYYYNKLFENKNNQMIIKSNLFFNINFSNYTINFNTSIT